MPRRPPLLIAALVLTFLTTGRAVVAKEHAPGQYNVLFIISDDLTLTALSCYGN